MAIIDTNLITAFSAKQDGKKIISVINGSRFEKGCHFSGKKSSLVIEFRDIFDFLDVTFENLGFTGRISMNGCGFSVPDIMVLLPDIKCFTYRFTANKPKKDKLVFETDGGVGEIIIINVSGFSVFK